MNDYCMYSKYYIGNEDGMMAEHSGIGEFSGEAADWDSYIEQLENFYV